MFITSFHPPYFITLPPDQTKFSSLPLFLGKQRLRGTLQKMVVEEFGL